MSKTISTESRFDVLFEPVQIGPVTAPNRFYQVPHCSGMGYGSPQTLAAMREVKAEGGWGVVNTEYCSIHPTSDDAPYPHCALWDEKDVRNMSLITDKVHTHGALAGVELWHGGMRSSNLRSRLAPLGPVSLPTSNDPFQCQAMDRHDIKMFKGWHRDAVRRAIQCEFDIIYVYATHTYLLTQFLDPTINTRTDEYGGSTENRFRLVRELLEETVEEVRHRAAVAVRIAVDDSESKAAAPPDVLSMLATYCDLFDVTVSDYGLEMGVSRYVNEASLEDHVKNVRQITGKPVVSVGRFTSPETMLSQVRRGILDFIGAARPSIADPFLPTKIREGRFDDIRECIGCNICYAGDGRAVPIRCTQNPTMGEEWRRGWHPERVPAMKETVTVLVVGAGPAGLEAASTLAKRGGNVLLAEATTTLGGRVNRECQLPGLSEWRRVRDYRVQLLSQHPNVSIHLDSRMSAQDVADTECEHVFVATGSTWRRDGTGRSTGSEIPGLTTNNVLTPDDIMDGCRSDGRYLIYDDDGYYVASAIAVLLAQEGNEVVYVTPDNAVSAWSTLTTEQYSIQSQLISLNVQIITAHYLSAIDATQAQLSCVYSARSRTESHHCVIPVTSREPEDGLWRDLTLGTSSNQTLVRIGDCRAPGIIATAIYDGHRAAREIGCDPQDLKSRREMIALSDH